MYQNLKLSTFMDSVYQPMRRIVCPVAILSDFTSEINSQKYQSKQNKELLIYNVITYLKFSYPYMPVQRASLLPV